MFDIRVERDGVVRVSGRFDASESDKALECLNALSGPLTLDCGDLEYISSTGLSVLMITFKRLRETGQTLRLVHVQPRVRNVFTYAGFHKLLEID
jgi:anti-anti-sigma factor